MKPVLTAAELDALKYVYRNCPGEAAFQLLAYIDQLREALADVLDLYVDLATEVRERIDWAEVLRHARDVLGEQ